MGVSGAGKTEIGSRLARELGADFIEGDTYHPRANIEKMSAGVALTDSDRQGWLRAIAQRIRLANDSGEAVVVSCSALRQSYRESIRAEAGPVRFVFLRGERILIEQRLRGRKGHFMPASLLDSQFATLEEPAPDEKVWLVDIAQPADQIVRALVERASA
jgi:gluconokinase